MPFGAGLAHTSLAPVFYRVCGFTTYIIKMQPPEPTDFGVTGVFMPNLRKFTLTVMLVFAAISASAETMVISEQEFNRTLELAKSAYLGKDYSGAVEQYTKAAKWGHKHSQFVLGSMYKSGLGTDKDLITGYAWMATAAENRNKDYRRDARKLLKSFDAGQREQAESLTAQIKSHYGMKATGVRCRNESRTGTNLKTVSCRRTNLAANGDYIVPVYPGDSIAATEESSSSQMSGT
jgi:hypothetical protein